MDIKPFQLVVLGIFGFFAVVGIIAFATFGNPSGSDQGAPVVLWGTLPEKAVIGSLSRYNSEASDENKLALIYEEYRLSEFDKELVEAVAEGRGPDLILLSQDSILKHRAKLSPIPFESFPERGFKDLFIEIGELYLTPDGVQGLPFSVDPMVMYWNRDLLSNVGRSLPPKTWEELLVAATSLTKKDQLNNILKSTIALGEFSNVTHAKDILTLLFMQAGDPIVINDQSGNLRVSFGERLGFSEVPANSALRFYTEFADPVKVLYSWNRSLPSSKDAFLAGDLALYLGFASEVSELVSRNPNLNFDVVMVPQIDGVDIKKTFGNVQALSLVRTSKNTNGAFRAMAIMTQVEFLSELETLLGLPPVRRDMLSGQAPNAISQIFYDSALIADAFLDPDDELTESIFRQMVENVTSGRETISQSISRVREALNALL